MSREQVRMMSARDKLVEEAGNPLTKLFRLVLIQLDTNPERWNRRLTLFLQSRLSRVRKTAKDIGQERNNFNRAIAKREITWKTFQKAVQIHGPVEYSMDITLTLRDGRKIKASTGRIKNPYAEIDSVEAMIGGRLSAIHDIDIGSDDEDDESEGHLTSSDVTDVTNEIGDPKQTPREQRDAVADRVSVRNARDFEDLK